MTTHATLRMEECFLTKKIWILMEEYLIAKKTCEAINDCFLRQFI